MKPGWELEAELALLAVATGGELTLSRADVSVVAKKGSLRDIVTELDRQVEAHISAVLAPSRHPIVGEESHPEGAALPPEDSPYWLVDPIDGTANFVAGVPFFSVSVGLSVRGQFDAGAVHLPHFKELYFTHGDQAAYLNGKPLQVADCTLADSLIAAGFSGSAGDPAFRKSQFELYAEINDASRGCLRLGSAAANLCYVAAGRLQACYGVHNRLWDIAGGVAVVRRAGGKVLIAREANSTRVSYLAGCPAVVDELRERLTRRNLVTFAD